MPLYSVDLRRTQELTITVWADDDDEARSIAEDVADNYENEASSDDWDFESIDEIEGEKEDADEVADEDDDEEDEEEKND